jgi:hypothetical protein
VRCHLRRQSGMIAGTSAYGAGAGAGHGRCVGDSD